MRGILFFLALLTCATSVSQAHAHSVSVTQGTISLSPDHRHAEYLLEVRGSDLSGVVTTDLPDPNQDAQALVDQYLRNSVSFEAIENLCTAGGPTLIAAQGAGQALDHPKLDSTNFLTFRWRLDCQTAITELALDYRLFAGHDDTHVSMVSIEGKVIALRGPDQNRLVLHPGVDEMPLSERLTSTISLGVEHILTGYDHLLFLISLLITLLVIRTKDAAWQKQPIRQQIKSFAWIVTSFTVAHSITLALATLGYVQLPSRLVESGIAITIAGVALHNILSAPSKPRPWLAFGFGLVHGLGFASNIAPALTHGGLVTTLLGFNLGIELGQLAFAIALLLILNLVSRRFSPVTFHKLVVRGVSGLVLLVGCWWTLQRILM